MVDSHESRASEPFLEKIPLLHLKVIYYPLYGINNYVLIWGDWLTCYPLRGIPNGKIGVHFFNPRLTLLSYASERTDKADKKIIWAFVTHWMSALLRSITNITQMMHW